MYAETLMPIREQIALSHRAAIDSYHQVGSWFDAPTRKMILEEFRFADAGSCAVCSIQKNALSPYSHKGEHESITALPSIVVEVIHKLATDSGRLTERWFKEVLDQGLSAEEYIEILGCVATAIVLDTFAFGIGASQLEPQEPVQTERPSKTINPEVIKEDAWVPVSTRSLELGPSGLPTIPNIARAMGLVPTAIMQFFSVMRSHYGLSELTSELSRSQTELIAARTSSYNDCFY